jgi:very-short-patch-repair endonuclease
VCSSPQESGIGFERKENQSTSMDRPKTTPQWIVELKARLAKEKREERVSASPKKKRKPKRKKGGQQAKVRHGLKFLPSTYMPPIKIESTALAKQRAEKLRDCMTSAEKVFLQLLQETLPRFRATLETQFPIGQYIADFYIPEIRTVIEIDGEYHRKRKRQDAIRTKQLFKFGVLRVVRFTNEEVRYNIIDVAEKISGLFGTAFAVRMNDAGLETGPYYFTERQKKPNSQGPQFS